VAQANTFVQPVLDKQRNEQTNMKLPRYTLKVVKNDTVFYRYNPPADAVEAGIVQRKQLYMSYEEAVTFCNEQNKLLDEWRKEHRYLKDLSEKSTIIDLYKSYINSIDYKKLSTKSRYDYPYYMKGWFDSRTAGTTLQRTRLCDLSSPICQRIYDEHAAHSVSLANHTLAVYKLVLAYAIRNGFTTFNPFKGVKAQAVKPRRVVWERHHLQKFMDTAFSKFEWRSVGIIVYMAYSWGQRLGDMRNLTWEQYDMDTGVLHLEQSKRRARVSIPTHSDLREMLEQQHKEFGWQKYIAPSQLKIKDTLQPYSLHKLAKVGKEIMMAAGLPAELQLMDMRRTAVTEMVQAGVPLPNIMSVTGHATPQSLTPYMRHTLKSATVAQEMRGRL
jgi:integrase